MGDPFRVEFQEHETVEFQEHETGSWYCHISGSSVSINSSFNSQLKYSMATGHRIIKLRKTAALAGLDDKHRGWEEGIPPTLCTHGPGSQRKRDSFHP